MILSALEINPVFIETGATAETDLPRRSVRILGDRVVQLLLAVFTRLGCFVASSTATTLNSLLEDAVFRLQGLNVLSQLLVENGLLFLLVKKETVFDASGVDVLNVEHVLLVVGQLDVFVVNLLKLYQCQFRSTQSHETQIFRPMQIVFVKPLTIGV